MFSRALLPAVRSPRTFGLVGRRFASDIPSYVLNAPSTEVTALRNGVRVASEVRAGRGGRGGVDVGVGGASARFD